VVVREVEVLEVVGLQPPVNDQVLGNGEQSARLMAASAPAGVGRFRLVWSGAVGSGGGGVQI
jgi:hypothetical protein